MTHTEMAEAPPNHSPGQNRVLEEPNVMSEIPNYNPQVFRAPASVQELCENVKHNLLRIYGAHKRTILLGVNCLVVLIVLVILTRSWSCDPDYTTMSTTDGDKLICEPFSTTENVVVDVEQNSSSHCYSSSSCITLGQTLKKEQGYYRYNFIIGIYGFVYVERGFKCQSQQGQPGLYIRFPVDSIYKGTDFMASQKAITKFNEILREGLECGKISHNYTITATGCGEFDQWCSRILQVIATDPSSDRGPIEHQKAEYFDHTQEGSLYDPFAFERVYNQHSKLVVCSKFMGK